MFLKYSCSHFQGLAMLFFDENSHFRAIQIPLPVFYILALDAHIQTQP
jgi:hypothetical protein